MIATVRQIDLLYHALGVRPDQRTPFRNHFLAGPGHHDQADLEALEAAGLMMRGRTPGFCAPGDVVFHVTEEGTAYALEHLPPAPKRSRYDEYLYAEYSHSFAEWLSIEVPKIQSSSYEPHYGVPDGHYRYRRSEFTRGERWSPEVVGDWKPTKKEAKASYKEALQARRTVPA